MPKSNKVKSSKAKSAKPAKAVKSKGAATKAKPAKMETKSSKPEVRLPEAAAPAQQAAPVNPAAKPKVEPPHPGKQEQPMWTRFNQGHNQKMTKGRFFRHQGR